MGSGTVSSRDPLATARRDLTARITALIAMLLVAGSLGVYVYVRHALFVAFYATHALAVLSTLENIDLTGPAPVVNVPAFQAEFEELNLTLGVVAVTIWDASGRELAHASIHHERLAMAGPEREVRGEGEHMIIVRRQPLGPAGDRGWIAIGRRAGSIAEHLLWLRRGLLLMLPPGLLGALAVGWFMTRRALRPVRDTFDQQRAFMADASHELRTPIAVIRAQAEVQLDAGDDTSGMRPAFGQIATTAAQMSQLVDDLLHLSRADAAALMPRQLPFALDALVEETMEALGPLAQLQGSRLAFVSPPGEIGVEADPAQLQRLVTLLVDNAVRHAGPGLVEVAVERRGREVWLRVSDSGPGIAHDLLPRVFDRFVRGKTSRAGGHGLGLAIARSIVQAHRGTISLDRGHLGGTTVTVTLPAPRG